MALTQDAIRKTRGTPQGEHKIAIQTSATLYVGSLVGRVESTGRAKAAAAATTERCVGLCVKLEGDSGVGTGVGDAAGTEYAIVQYGMEALITVKTAIRTNTSLGLNVFVADDDQVGGTAVGTSATRNVVGELTAFEASDKSTGWVALGNYAPNGNIAV